MKALNIVLHSFTRDGERTVEFVEIENDRGESVRLGELSEPDDFGYHRIRITPEDITNACTN